ncbi:MAG: dihydroorotate dehydrogenase electron transfer subunit [Pirellulaceae bacterium]|nr:dihydroorotate dehydrogenase electron transfer subunit [Pirellulaceae bacterium]
MTIFADHAEQLCVPILANDQLAKDTYRVRLDASELAARAVPGQFFMVRLSGCNDPLIARALALFDRCSGLELVYLAKGKFTTRLARMQPGELVDVTGPLGNGFSNQPVDHLIMVAGGIGQTPFLAVAREALGLQSFGLPARTSGYAKRVSFCYGVRSADHLAGLDLFQQAGVAMHVATEDGSIGPPQRVTSPLEKLLLEENGDTTRVVVCGPEPMMEAVAHLAHKYHVPCEVSLETPMACGIGICFTCVARIGSQDDWDYKRTCVEGPVFKAEDVVW